MLPRRNRNMAHHRFLLGAILVGGILCWLSPNCLAQERQTRASDPPRSPSPEKSPEPNLHPKPPVPLAAETLNESIRRGVQFLVKCQNKDGSWGDAGRTKALNIIAEVGSHHAFRMAVTAMCVTALLEAGGESTDVQSAIDRGEAVLFQELPKVRRDTPMLIYNVWTHAYGIQALVHMHRRFPDT